MEDKKEISENCTFIYINENEFAVNFHKSFWGSLSIIFVGVILLVYSFISDHFESNVTFKLVCLLWSAGVFCFGVFNLIRKEVIVFNIKSCFLTKSMFLAGFQVGMLKLDWPHDAFYENENTYGEEGISIVYLAAKSEGQKVHKRLIEFSDMNEYYSFRSIVAARYPSMPIREWNGRRK